MITIVYSTLNGKAYEDNGFIVIFKVSCIYTNTGHLHIWSYKRVAREHKHAIKIAFLSRRVPPANNSTCYCRRPAITKWISWPWLRHWHCAAQEMSSNSQSPWQHGPESRVRRRGRSSLWRTSWPWRHEVRRRDRHDIAMYNTLNGTCSYR